MNSDKRTDTDLGVRVGHVNLRVSDLDRSILFYAEVMGLELRQRFGKGGAFLAAGGYHHHVGLNTWAAGSPVASERDARLLEWQLVLPDPSSVAAAARSVAQSGARIEQKDREWLARDPWNITVRLGIDQSRE